MRDELKKHNHQLELNRKLLIKGSSVHTFAVATAVFLWSIAMTGCNRQQAGRWQLCDGHFYNYEAMSAEHPMSTTFLLDTQTGRVWYATPASTKYPLTPEFKPVFIDTSLPSHSGLINP
jgi:hypothetical protein